LKPHQITLVSLCALVLWYLYWAVSTQLLFKNPIGELLWLAPLVALFPWLYKKAPYAYSVMGFVSIFYLMHGAMIATLPDGPKAFGIVSTLLSACIFFGVVGFLRPFKKAFKKAQKDQKL